MATSEKNKPRLGRGLSSLLSVSNLPVVRDLDPAAPPAGSGEPTRESTQPPTQPTLPDPSSDPRVILLPLDAIRPNPHQPRRDFNPATLADLASSLKQNGVIQPILVRPAGGGVYELIAGERRWRASRLAELATIPAIVRDVDSLTQAQMALVENIHRDDLNPVERAQGYQTLMQQLGLTQSELAIRLGEDRSQIAHHLRLLDLCEPVRKLIREGKLGMTHARLLAGVPDMLKQQQLAERCIAQDLTAKNLERLIESTAAQVTLAPTKRTVSPHIADMEKSITRSLGMRVQLHSTGRKGRLTIHYANLDQFDQLLERMGVKVE